MTTDYVAHQSITVNAPISKVWKALVDPEQIKQYLFGTTTVSDWVEGSPIVWKGEWDGKTYEDKGVILRLEPNRILQYSHFSPLSGVPDVPENYHTVTIELSGDADQTFVALSQDNNATEEERDHLEQNWAAVLAGFKQLLEH